MRFRGRVQNGVVLLDTGQFEEGTIVEVEPVSGPSASQRGSTAAALACSGLWQDSVECDTLLREVQLLRDMDPQLERGSQD